MRLPNRMVAGGLVAIVGLHLLCTKKETAIMPVVTTIVGNADLIRNGVRSPLPLNETLRPNDTVRINDDAKIKCTFSGGGSWYLSNKVVMSIGTPIELADQKQRLPIGLNSGAFLMTKESTPSVEYQITLPEGIIRTTAADLAITIGKSDDISTLLFDGFATFTPHGGNEVIIPVCNQLLMQGEGPGALNPIPASEIELLQGWVGATLISSIIFQSGCSISQSAAPTKNEPPQWQKLPRETALLNETIIDTVLARDPEQSVVQYALSQSPKGMKIDPVSGILTYSATKPGKHAITILATDAENLTSPQTVTLTVLAGLRVRLSAPATAKPDIPVTISAIPGKLIGLNPARLCYRFDFEGDGMFDFPASGKCEKIRPVTRHIYKKEGIYSIKVEIATPDGKTARASRLITVNAPPVAQLTTTPPLAAVGSMVTLDLSESFDSFNGSKPLNIRIDTDGNGTWDLPGPTGYLTDTKVAYVWQEAGTYNIIAELTDKNGLSSRATATVLISKGLSGITIAGPDTVHIGDSTTYTCTSNEVEFPIKKYAWSFDGDTIYEKLSPISVASTHFTTAGTIAIICRATDEKNQSTQAVKRVVVINSQSVIDAGGPYSIAVNSPITLVGSAKDRDNKITTYSWDVNGDGKTNYTSATDAKTIHTFTKSGHYTAYFLVTTDDGNTNRDSATVTVTNKPPRAKACENIVTSKKRKVKLSGTGEDDDGTIVRYEWDFDGNGTADWTSEETGNTVHAFTTYTTALFKVVDSDGASATDSVTIIICPEGMETIEKGKFCIDAYEYPNKRNATPQVNVTYQEAQQICSSLGKRLCSSSEWETACTDGKKRYAYPYGKKYNVNRCNTLGNPTINNSIAKSGSFVTCKNRENIFDMSGNVAEWTESDAKAPSAAGGSWQSGEERSSCTSNVQLQPGRKYFYVGFRCCK